MSDLFLALISCFGSDSDTMSVGSGWVGPGLNSRNWTIPIQVKKNFSAFQLSGSLVLVVCQHPYLLSKILPMNFRELVMMRNHGNNVLFLLLFVFVFFYIWD